MSLPPLQPFLLHEDSMVRDSVGFRFFESWSKDTGLVPLVLEACRTYGEEDTLNLLSFACRFRLDTRGLVESFRALALSHPPFVEQWVASAPLDLVSSRAELTRSLLSTRARARLSRRGTFHHMKPPELWRRLEAVSGRMDERVSEPGDWDEVEDLTEALSVVERRERVLELVSTSRALPSAHFRWAIVDLAGAMELEGAVESLVSLLGEKDDGLGRAAVEALVRISAKGSSSNQCVRRIGDRYPGGSRRFRRFALAALKAIQSEESRALLFTLADSEEDPALRGRIYDGLRFHFSDEAEALLRRELESPTSWMIPEEIQKALSVSSYIRGETDPAVERWRRELEARGDGEIYFHIPFLGLTGEGTESS
jgi:hypothetical protein